MEVFQETSRATHCGFDSALLSREGFLHALARTRARSINQTLGACAFGVCFKLRTFVLNMSKNTRNAEVRGPRKECTYMEQVQAFEVNRVHSTEAMACACPFNLTEDLTALWMGGLSSSATTVKRRGMRWLRPQLMAHVRPSIKVRAPTFAPCTRGHGP